MNLEDRLSLAVEHQRAGRFSEADVIYRALLPTLRERAAAEPTARWSVILGETLLRLDQPSEALAALRQASNAHPNAAEIHGAIGHVYERLADWPAAESAYDMALALNPHLIEARCNLGHVLSRQRRWPRAIVELQTALAANPNIAIAHYHLATALRHTGRLSAAAQSLQWAVDLAPTMEPAWVALGDVLLDTGERIAAVAAYRKAALLNPSATNHLNLGAGLSATDEADESIEQMQLAVAAEPKWSDAYKGLGQALYRGGELDGAIEAFERAVELDPKNAAADSHALYCRLFRGTDSPLELKELHERWARRHTSQIVPLPPAMVDPSTDRRLRIGYVSPNFRNQAVVLFILPILENYDPWEVEVFCYSDARLADHWTQRCKLAVDEWRDTADLSHEQLARVIRADKIDILIDLTGHIGDGRLQAFAYRPAPVQAMYIGYQATSGLEQIDYVITDDWADPPGQTDPYWTEIPWRLPEPFFAYQPPTEAPAIGPLPAAANGYITFGCLNNIAKVTPRCIELWSRVLHATENSRMILLSATGQRVHNRLRSQFAKHNIDPNRVEFVPRQSVQDYFDTYNQIDIALDPIPFNGHTTSCDAAYMGLPTISLAGNCYAHRYGSSVMRHLGLSALVTDTEAEYTQVATRLATNRAELISLRMALRMSMSTSTLMDGKRMAQTMEAAYRGMWKAWLRGERAGR